MEVDNEENELEEFVEFIQTDSLGNIVGDDIEEQWSPRINAPLTTKPAYPNPVSSTFTIEFVLEQNGTVTIEILNHPESIMATLLKANFGSGEHKLKLQSDSFNPKLESGKIYQIRISSGSNKVFGNIKFQD